ncbi:TolC family protein [Aquabacterium sp.]|uniref:TolC family protein n=1 Tax=Aquabacterium sp. TaxID=1872578 RepID=UPI003782D505
MTQAQAASPLTLEEAWRLADAAHPALLAKRAQLAAAEGARTDAAAALFNNPQVSLENTRRTVPQTGLPSDRRSEWSAGVSQTIEIAGQRGHRLAASEAALASLRAEVEDARRQVRADVAQAFYRVLALQQRAAIDDEALKLFDSTAQAVQKRRSAGEDTKLDANVAAVEAERARNQVAQAREQLIEARAELATRLQLPPGAAPLAAGDLAAGSTTAYSLESLLSSIDAQPRLRALAARQDSAGARLRLEQASRTPDVTVGLNVGREGPGDARERLTTLLVSVPLPLFKRNAAGIGQASSELSQARIEREAAARDTRAQVYTLWTRLQSLQARVRRLQDAVLPALADNQQLSVKSQRAGQIGLLELIVVNRQALDARRDLVDALAELQTVRQALEAAAGWPQ